MAELYDRVQVAIAVSTASSASDVLKAAIARAYAARGFPGDDPTLLFLGLAEEVGELAELINIGSRPKYHVSERKQELLENLHENVAAELGDILTYVAAIANYYQVTPSFEQWHKKREPQE